VGVLFQKLLMKLREDLDFPAEDVEVDV
jgi:hypothetical protein